MNSEEALFELYKQIKKHRRTSKKIIEKDLEVLEILRKYIYFDKKDNYIKMFDIKECITNFDFEIIKEWLEE